MKYLCYSQEFKMKGTLRRSSSFLLVVAICSTFVIFAFIYSTIQFKQINKMDPTTLTNPLQFTSQSLLASNTNSSTRKHLKQKENVKPGECQEKQKIGFLKTHKTASSTIQNIFLRYGLMNRLEFVLPSRGNHLSNPKHFYFNLDQFKVDFLDAESSKLIWHERLKTSQGYQIFALHTCWNQQEVSSLLGPDAVYITILRNPTDAFESLFSYTKFENKLKLTLSQYIKSLNVSSTLYQHRINGYLGLNQQLFDLGQNRSDLFDRSETELMMKKMEDSFDLVMISEKFDESIVLMADLLCWPLEKVTSLKVNVRKPGIKFNLTKEETQILSQWQEGEELVYNHFKQKLDEKIEAYGKDRMSKSVAKLKELNNAIEKKCIEGITDKEHLNSDSDLAPWSPDVIAYKVNDSDFQCKLMAMNENVFVDKVRKSQLIRWKAIINGKKKKTKTKVSNIKT